MSARSSGRRPSLRSGLALTAATIVLCLLAGELITRLADPGVSLWDWPCYAVEAPKPAPGETQFAYDPTLGWAPIPGSSGTMLGVPLSFTEQGTREQNRDRPQAARPLIIAFGDSMTEGYGVGNDETWPAHLERLLGVRVLNAGVRGYGLDQIVLRAEHMIPALEPSAVVLAFIADDISRTALSVRDAKGKPYFVPDGEGLALRNVPVQGAGRSWITTVTRHILGYSHLFDRIVNGLGVQQLWYGSEVATEADSFVVSCRLMHRLAAVVKRQRAKALVVALPEQGVFLDAKAAAGQHEALTQVLGCASKAGLATLDILEAFQKENVGRDIDAYYTMMHFSDRSSAIAARSIAAALAARE
ncbi:MAG: GDSL-type esterase/lipase family protein [Reyranellaceae bacterium]